MEEPVAFIGKLANVYQPPAYHTSNLIRRLHYQNEPICPRDRTVLDFYGELESMRLRYAPDPRIPNKNDLYELSLHELWGHGDSKTRKNGNYNPYEPSTSSEAFTTGKNLGPNVLANPIEAITAEPLFLQALRVFEIQPRIAHFMLCSKKANVLQEYCWPVCSRRDELSLMMDIKQKTGFFRSKFDIDRIGDTSIDRFLMLSNEVKSYKPRVSDGQLVWSENFHIVPRHRAFERTLRQPPSVLIEMARNNLHRQIRNDGVIIVPRPKYVSIDGSHNNGDCIVGVPVISGKDILQVSCDSITLAGMTTRPAPGLKPKDIEHSIAHRIAHERQLGPNSFARTPHIRESLQEQAFELALARYFEATLDALLEAVFQFILPILRIAAEDHRNISTESSGTFKLSNNRANNSKPQAIVDEQQELLNTLAKSTVIAIESVRFHGKKHNQKPSLFQTTDKIESISNNSNSNRHWRKRKFNVACHHDRLAVNSLQLGEKLNSVASLRLKRRHLDVTLELPDSDKKQFDQRVKAWRRPKSIAALRKHYLSLKQATEEQQSVEEEVESINDDSTIVHNEEILRNRKRNRIPSSQIQKHIAKKRKREGNESTEFDDAHEENDDEDDEEDDDMDDHQNKKHKINKKHIPESIPLPVPLARIYLPRSWAFRKRIGMRMLRWQKGGIMGSGRKKKLSIRMLKNHSQSHSKDPDDDMSVISAITGDDLDVLEKSSIASFALSADNDSSSTFHTRQTTSSSLAPTNAMKLHLSAPSVAGTLETSFHHNEPAIDSPTGEFQVVQISTNDAENSSMLKNQAKQNVNWEHVLTILELVRDICAAKTGDADAENVFVKIHPDLPGFPLDMQTLKRIRYRLVALFTNFLREEDAQHVPHIAVSDVEAIHSGLSSRIQHTSFLASTPSLLRQPAKYPKHRYNPDTAPLPPSFLLSDNLLQDSQQCLSDMYANFKYKKPNESDGDEHNINNRKRVRFTVDDQSSSKRKILTDKILEKAALQSIYGYGGVNSEELLTGVSKGEFGDNDQNANYMGEEHDDDATGMRINHYLFPRTVILGSKKISLRYKQHLSRLHKRYPLLRERLMMPTETEKKENPYVNMTMDTEDNDDSNHYNYSSVSASRKYSPFPLLSSPMKLRPSLSQNSFTSTTTTATRGRTKSTPKKEDSPPFDVTESRILSTTNISISPSASVMGSLHDYDSFPVPSAYAASPMLAAKPAVLSPIAPVFQYPSPGPALRVTTRRGRTTAVNNNDNNKTVVLRSERQATQMEELNDSFGFYAIDSAEL